MATEKNSSTQNSPVTGATILAIISVVLAAGWIAFAYYIGGSTDASGNRILLLHPIVAMLLIFLLIRVYRWVEIKIIATLEIVMIALWLFVTMLGVLTPFILGFGFAYLLRFISNAIPFDKPYQRRLAMVAILIVCGGVFFWTSRQIGRQASQMSKGLQQFYHESVLPFVVGETLEALAIEAETSGEATKFYLGTNHGVYIIEGDVRSGVTNGDIIGKRVQALARTDKGLYAGAPDGLYRLEVGTEKATWAKVENIRFANPSVRAISHGRDASSLYVGTASGLYASQDAGETWFSVSPEIFASLTIVSITSEGNNVYVAARGEASQAPQTVLWMQAGSNMEWQVLPSEGLTLQSLAVGNGTFYAGTTSGVYTYEGALGQGDGQWNEVQGEAHLPTSISLLAATSSHVYAGDKTVIRHSSETGDWPLAVAHNEGRFNTLKDTAIGRQVQQYLTESIPSVAQAGGNAVKWLSASAGSFAFQFGGFLATLSFAFIVFVYAGQKFEDYIRGLTLLIPATHREQVKVHLREIDRNMQAYLRGQVTVIAIVSVISVIAYGVIGVPFALLVGLLAGFCNAIPTFGPFIGGAFAFIAMLMGLAAGDFSMGFDFLIRCFAVLIAILGIQTIDNSLISPKVMSKAVEVDALLIMFGVIVGGSLLGFWGVLLAIPILVVIKSVIAVSQGKISTTEEQ